MADSDEFPVEAPADPRLVCPECGHVSRSPMLRGLHRKRAHGVIGKGAGKARKAPARKRAAAGPTEAKEPTRSQIRKEIERSVTEAARKAGIGTSLWLPVTGGYLLDQGAELGQTLGSLAERNPALARWLLQSSDAMDYITLVFWAGGLVYAAGVDLNRVPGDGRLAEGLGVAAVVRAVDKEDVSRETIEEELRVAIDDQDGFPRPDILGSGEGARSQSVVSG